MFKWINLFDLDDTIINSKHRSKFDKEGNLDVKHWNQNSTLANIKKDHLIFNMTNVLKYFQQRKDCWNVAITSRELEDNDFIFFKTHDIMFNDTLHRGSSHLDTEYKNRFKLKDYELKNVLLTNYIAGYNLGFAFDDKPVNLDVFSKHGYRVFNANHINYNDINYLDVISEAEQRLN